MLSIRLYDSFRYMKRLVITFSSLFLLFGTALPLVAQEQELEQSVLPKISIFDVLAREEPNKGRVVVIQDPQVKALVGRYLSGENIEKNEEETFLKFSGYRTQVFSGNNQRKSKDEAAQKAKEVKELFPDVPAYISYTAPFWRLRIGDFRSKEEAFILQRQLMEAFPAFAKEMYIVKDEVKIPL